VTRLLAWARLRQGKYQEAFQAASRAVSLDPNDAANFALRAYAREMLGKRSEAMKDLEAAALLDRRFREKYAQAMEGGRIYDPEEDSSLLGAVAAAPGGSPIWPLGPAAALGAGLGLWALLRRRKERSSLPQSMAAPAPNGLLAGKYALGHIIGRGGMGDVYEAFDLSLGRAVAVKRMSARISEPDSRARGLFIKEARTVAALHHPAIVGIYEILEQGSELYLVFEFVRGKTLQQLLVEEGRLPLGRALEILRPVCRALEFAHGLGLVHRDLKPANIMATEEGHVKLMDFGIARSLAEGALPEASPASGEPLLRFARTQTVAGTPPYMAPETEQGLVCKEADVYSLGVCLYEMLTGRLPFGEDAQKLDLDFPRPASLAPGLGASVDSLLEQALQPAPESRLRTPGEFLARLEAAAREPACSAA